MKCCVKNIGIGFWKKKEDQIGGVPKTMTNNTLVARCILVPIFLHPLPFQCMKKCYDQPHRNQ